MTRQQRYPARSQLRLEAEAAVAQVRRAVERELRHLVMDLRDEGLQAVNRSDILIGGVHYGIGDAHGTA